MWNAILLAIGVGTSGFYVHTAPGESLWVETAGAGETVVLIPGIFGSAFGFRHVAPLLNQAGYRTVIIEPLGVGRSHRPRTADYSLTAQATRIAAVLDTLTVSGAVLVAHSVGGSLALRLAQRRPDLVRAVVSIEGGAAESAVGPAFKRAMRFASLIKLFGGRKAVRGEIARQLTQSSGDPAWVTADVIDGYAAPVVADLGRTLEALKAMARAREPEAFAPALASIHTPVLLLLGGAPHASSLDSAHAALLRGSLPAIHIDVVEGAGHYIHEEKPDAVVAAVMRFERMTRTVVRLAK